MQRINRFPKMMVLQKERAIALGETDAVAKAIGFAEAKKYAIFKNSFLRRRKSTGVSFPGVRKERPAGGSPDLREGRRIHPNFRLEMSPGGFPVVAGQEVRPEEYDKYLRRFDPETITKLESWARGIIEKTPRDLLLKETTFFNKVWKTVRDIPIL